MEKSIKSLKALEEVLKTQRLLIDILELMVNNIKCELEFQKRIRKDEFLNKYE